MSEPLAMRLRHLYAVLMRRLSDKPRCSGCGAVGYCRLERWCF